VRIHSCLTPFVGDGLFHPTRNYGSSCPRALRNWPARPALRFCSAVYNYALAQNDWGNALQELDRFEEAAAHYREAVRIDPAFAEAQSNWGTALARMGHIDEALTHWQEAVRINPDFAEVHSILGNALAQLGRLDDAAAHFRQALRIKPELPGVAENLRRVETVLQSKGPSTRP
ncbi:MAG: tetratricopeptide repeat protein, partial [Planctomycetota bacterium]|nr:tetratricopeptide repeat protein [Planctomycetota bacterium]